MSNMLEGLLPVGAEDAITEAAELLKERGILLTAAQKVSLCRAERDALTDTGRLAFGETAAEQILRGFWDSAWLAGNEDGLEEDCAAALEELTWLFYQFKNETELPDELLIRRMRELFDGPCRGSAELLGQVELSVLTGSDEEEPEKEEDGDEWD